jgi:uncharacterized membrane protein
MRSAIREASAAVGYPDVRVMMQGSSPLGDGRNRFTLLHAGVGAPFTHATQFVRRRRDLRVRKGTSTMIGFAIGTACLAGLVAMRRRACGGSGPGSCAGGGSSCHGRGPRRSLRRLFWHLGASREQARALRDAAASVRDAAFARAGEVRRTRDDVAEALRADSLDSARIEAAFARHDEALAAMRAAVRDALAKVHATLDAKQRDRLADLVEWGPLGFGAGGWS